MYMDMDDEINDDEDARACEGRAYCWTKVNYLANYYNFHDLMDFASPNNDYFVLVFFRYFEFLCTIYISYLHE